MNSGSSNFVASLGKKNRGDFGAWWVPSRLYLGDGRDSCASGIVGDSSCFSFGSTISFRWRLFAPFLARHPSGTKLYRTVRDYLWWPNWELALAIFVSWCLGFQQVKAVRQRLSGLL